MVKATVEDQPDRTVPEDTLLKAELTEVKDKTIEWVDKQTKENKSAVLLEWWFKITDKNAADGLYEGRRIKGETDSKITNHPNNRFRNWAEALMGRELPVGAGIDTDEDLVGLPCIISVRHRDYVDKKTGEKRVAEEIDEVMPLSGGVGDDDVPF